MFTNSSDKLIYMKIREALLLIPDKQAEQKEVRETKGERAFVPVAYLRTRL